MSKTAEQAAASHGDFARLLLLMANVHTDISSEWGDEDESTQLYQPGMLDDAREALDSLDPASEVHSEEEPETWFISADGQHKQPLSAAEVVDRCRAGTLSEQTLVWHEGLDDWTRLSDVPELSRILDALARGHVGASRNLPPLPSPPSSRAVSSKSFARQPAPLGSASGVLESDATQVYAKGAAARLKAALVRSEPGGQLSDVEDRLAQSPPVFTAHAAAVPRQRAVGPATLNERFAVQLAHGTTRARLVTLAGAAGVCLAIGALSFHRHAGGADVHLAEYDLDATTSRAASGAEGAGTAPDVSVISKPVTTAAAPQPSSKNEPEEIHADGAGTTAQQVSRPEGTLGLAETVAATIDSRTDPAPDHAAPPSRPASPGALDRDFDEAAARSAMASAAKRARNCRPKGGPRGAGRVSVRIEPSGAVSGATILTPKFEGTVAGSCIRMLFRQASVPAFTGPAKTVVQKFSVPE